MPRKQSLSPAQRELRARLGAHKSWANTSDRSERTAPGRAASPAGLEWFEKQIDPEGVLPAEERTRRAESLRKAHYTRLAFLSAKARRGKRGKRPPLVDQSEVPETEQVAT